MTAPTIAVRSIIAVPLYPFASFQKDVAQPKTTEAEQEHCRKPNRNLHKLSPPVIAITQGRCHPNTVSSIAEALRIARRA